MNKDWIKIQNDNVIIKDYQGIRNDILEQLIKINEMKYKVKENDQEVEKYIEVDKFPKYSADYIFINNLALSIWNNLKVINNIYDLHKVELVEGKYLDKIMSFYGYNRLQERIYVLEVTFELNDKEDENYLSNLSKKSYLELISENLSIDIYSINEWNQTYEFNIVKEIRNLTDKNTGKKYITLWIKAKKYYESLTFDRIKSLKLQLEGLNVNSVSDITIIYDNENKKETQYNCFNKIIATQRKRENDFEFKSHLFNNDKNNNNMLVQELEKIENIKSIEILNPNENDLDIKNGQICVLLERNENVVYENSDDILTNEGIKLKNEIETSISEFLPIGFQTILLPGDVTSKNYLKEIESKTSKSDFILHKIKYSFVKTNYTVLSFQIIDIKKEDIDSLCEDLIEKINSNSVLFTLQKDILWEYIKLLFTIKDNKIYLLKDMFDNNYQGRFTKVTNITWDNEDILNPSTIKVNGNKDMKEYTSDNTKSKFRPTFSEYKYQYNKDGSFTIIIY